MAGTINFLDKVPQIAKSAGVLTQQQLYDVDLTQAIFDVAHEQGVNLVPAGQSPNQVLQRYNSPQKIAALVDQYGLDRRAINDKAQMFSQGYQAQNAPYFMDTLKVFGHITDGQKEPLLAAQFGARTAETVRQLKTGRTEMSLQDALAMRKPLSNESGYLRAAQNVDQMAKILSAAVVENPSLKNEPEIERALTALELLSAQSFQRASEAAKITGMSFAADDMEKHQAGQEKGFFLSKHAATSMLVSKLEAGMSRAAEEVAKKNPQQGRAMAAIMTDRKAEIKELKVFGSLVLPDFLMKKTELSFVDRLNQQGQGQGNGRGF